MTAEKKIVIVPVHSAKKIHSRISKRGHGFTGVDLPGGFRHRGEIDVIVEITPEGRIARKHNTGRMTRFVPGAFSWSEDYFFVSVEETATLTAAQTRAAKAAAAELFEQERPVGGYQNFTAQTVTA